MYSEPVIQVIAPSEDGESMLPANNAALFKGIQILTDGNLRRPKFFRQSGYFHPPVLCQKFKD